MGAAPRRSFSVAWLRQPLPGPVTFPGSQPNGAQAAPRHLFTQANLVEALNQTSPRGRKVTRLGALTACRRDRRTEMASSISPPAARPSENTGEADWFIATRATNHMTGNQSLISNLVVPVNNQVVEAGEGEGMQVCGRGYVNTETVVLPDVWYVPGLTMNQVSVGQLTQDPDLIVEIGGGACRISKKSDGSVLGGARLRSDHKYVVDFLKIELN